MATQATTVQQRAAAPSAEPHDAQGNVSTRRLKKREIDRRCQRQARERTKTRIAYLEGLVEDFRRQDSSGQLATLMAQLKEVEDERNIMAKALKDIKKAMDIHKPLISSTEDGTDDKMDMQPTRPANETRIERESSSVSPFADDLCLPLRAESTTHLDRRSPTKNFDLARFSPVPSLPLQDQDQLFAPEVVPLQGDGMSSPGVLVQAKNAKEPNPMPCNYADNWSARRNVCSCNSCHERQPGRRAVWQGNYWRYANEVLSERFQWTDDVAPESDALSDDIPIRVLLEGWDAVEKRAPLHPSWQILRRIDETLFSMCSNVERLAIMRAMHILLQFHTEATTERYERLPPWYMRRPSQKIAHSYAIDYFAWPGLRERFIFGEHNYCGNEFWTLFTTSLKISWPYEFRDCYTREVETGLYKFSPTFDLRLADIKSWTMGPDIFRRYPELYSDMPSFNCIPQTPSSVQARLLAHMQQKKLLPVAPSPRVTETNVIQIEDNDEVKPETLNSPYVPMHSLPVSSSESIQTQQHHFQQQIHTAPQQPMSSSFMFGDMNINPTAALDEYVYGTMPEPDFASTYQTDYVNGYTRAVF